MHTDETRMNAAGPASVTIGLLKSVLFWVKAKVVFGHFRANCYRAR